MTSQHYQHTDGNTTLQQLGFKNPGFLKKAQRCRLYQVLLGNGFYAGFMWMAIAKSKTYMADKTCWVFGWKMETSTFKYLKNAK